MAAETQVDVVALGEIFVDFLLPISAPLATVTATSGTTTVQTSACTSCCGAACTTDIHGPNGCEAVVNRYCMRLYNFTSVTGGSCLPSEFTFEVTHFDRADFPGGSTCNYFSYTPGTFAPTSTAGCSGYSYSMESVGLFSINWNATFSKFTLTMAGPRIRATNGSGVATDFRLYNPGSGYRLASIACSPFKLTWQYCYMTPSASSTIAYQFDMDMEYCVASMSGNPAANLDAQDLIQQSKQRLALPCVHRGQPLEESASCGCGGAVLTACSVYGQCRPYGTATDAQVCTRCPDYQAP